MLMRSIHALAGVVLLAQVTAPPFEVASVKENRSGPGSVQRLILSGDRVTSTYVTVRTLIQEAYAEVPDIVGGPDWIGKAGQPNFDVPRFDISAKAAIPTTRDQLRLMLRGLLADRFKLAMHQESRASKVWTLVRARKDGRLGPNLRQAKASCEELRASAQPGESGPALCGMDSFVRALGTGTMSVRGFRLDQLGIVTNEFGPSRPVVDKTGLTGTFDWDLKWTPQRFQQATFDRGRFPTIDPDGPSIFTALEEQLGLKLESQEGTESVLVIDRVERPTEN